MGFTRWLLRPRDKQVLQRAGICQGPYLLSVGVGVGYGLWRASLIGMNSRSWKAVE